MEKGYRRTKMAEYIERSEVIELLKSTEINGTPYIKRIVKTTVDLAIEAISDDVFTADVEEAKHGHWICHADAGVTECSVCHNSVSEYVEYPRCMFCGAKMDEEVKNV